MDDEATKPADDAAFFSQLLADLEHDEAPAAGAPASTMDEDLWALDLPVAEADFSAEDRSLRALLVSFYKSRNPANLVSCNDIVKAYRCRSCDLWAQLAVKYQLPPVEAVELLAKTLYPWEALGFRGTAETSPSAAPAEPRSEAELVELLAKGGLDALRLFLGAGAGGAGAWSASTPEVRALGWKLLLGYLPADAAQWPSVQQGRRAAYSRRRKESLRVEGQEVDLVSAEPHLMERMEGLKDEVEQTVRHFHHQVQHSSLLSIMAVYLVSSDGNLPLVQGMTHMAALLLHVFTLAATAPGADVEAVEAEAFWCFAALMAEIKGRISDVQPSTASVHNLVGTSDSLLAKYDAQLAEHFQALGFEPGVVCLRWFMLLFAKDADFVELLSWWDAFLADAQRFELVGHLCVALLLQHRDELLDCHSLLDLAELLQRLPGRMPGTGIGAGSAGSALRRAQALRAFEQRAARQATPQFPAPSTVEVVQGVAGAFFSGIFSNF